MGSLIFFYFLNIKLFTDLQKIQGRENTIAHRTITRLLDKYHCPFRRRPSCRQQRRSKVHGMGRGHEYDEVLSPVEEKLAKEPGGKTPVIRI